MTDESPQEKSPIKEKIEKQLQDLRAEEKFDKLYSFTKTHTLDSIAYVILIAGLIISIFNSFWGGILIGIIPGFYFFREITLRLRNYHAFI